jgi:hypothetical protein
MVIIAIILIVSFLLLFGCVSVGEEYHTYRLEGVPLDHETETFFIFWWSNTDDGGQELKIANNSNNAREFQIFDFSIGESIIGDYGGTWIWGEPYTFRMNFHIYDAQKIIVNKLIFRSKSAVIDLRESIGVSYMSKRDHSFINFSEEKIMDFRKFNIIDIDKLNNERRIIEKIEFIYDNVGISFMKDRFFTIECDLTFESDVEGYETENYNFLAKFNRIKYNEMKVSWLTFLLLYLILEN